MRLRGTLIVAAVVLLAACPLPFEFVPSNTTGEIAASNDPANPSITSAPIFSASQTTTGSSVSDADSADVLYYSLTSNRNLTIELSTLTLGATIFYRIDGTDPIPGRDGTEVYTPGSPLQYSGHNAGDQIRAIAIGPGMYPSSASTADVLVQYDVAAAPTFTPDPGGYQTDLSVQIETSEPNGTILYRVDNGFESTGDPVSGGGDTETFTGTGIPVIGAGTARTVSAMVVVPEKLNSTVTIGTFLIDIDLVPVTGLTATTTLSDRVDLSWGAPASATDYEVSRSPDGSTFTVIAASTGGATSYSDTTGTHGITYTYRVRALFGTVPGPYASTTGLKPASAPSGFTASTNLTDRIELSWNTVSGADEYEISRSADGTTFSVLNTITGTSFADTSASSGITYTYRVRALFDTVFGPYATTTGSRFATPANLQASVPAPDRIVLTWDPVLGATDYRVYWAPAGSAFTQIAASTSGATTFTATGAPAALGITNEFYVVAVSGTTESPASNVAVGRVPLYWYLSGDVEPWFSNDNIDAMNDRFAEWGQASFTPGSTTYVTPAQLFQSGLLVFIEGGDQNAAHMANWLTSASGIMGPWVSSGGRLFVNAAPNVAGNISIVIGSTYTILYDSARTQATDSRTAQLILSSHPIRTAITPISTNYTGSSFGHAFVTGPGITQIMQGTTVDSIIGVVLAEFSYGSGHVLIGGMTMPDFHDPQPDADTLRSAILQYLDDQ